MTLSTTRVVPHCFVQRTDRRGDTSGRRWIGQVMFAMNKQVSVAGGFAHIIPGRFLKKVSQGASLQLSRT